MGLDWVVLARTDGAREINPTEVLGIKRATRDDPEVLAEIRRIWEAQGSNLSFEKFLADNCDREVPPIVIGFGPGLVQARPLFPAEVQYYGFRGKVLEPSNNLISSWAESQKKDFDWLYETMPTEEVIVARGKYLSGILANWSKDHPEVHSYAIRYITAFKQGDMQLLEELNSKLERLESGDQVYDLCAYLDAIEWLKFWADKGFKIAPDY